MVYLLIDFFVSMIWPDESPFPSITIAALIVHAIQCKRNATPARKTNSTRPSRLAMNDESTTDITLIRIYDSRTHGPSLPLFSLKFLQVNGFPGLELHGRAADRQCDLPWYGYWSTEKSTSATRGNVSTCSWGVGMTTIRNCSILLFLEDVVEHLPFQIEHVETEVCLGRVLLAVKGRERENQCFHVLPHLVYCGIFLFFRAHDFTPRLASEVIGANQARLNMSLENTIHHTALACWTGAGFRTTATTSYPYETGRLLA